MGGTHTAGRYGGTEKEGDVGGEADETAPARRVERALRSPVSFGTDAGVSVELIHTLSSILAAMLLAVVVVYAAVVANVTRRAHTPETHGPEHWNQGKATSWFRLFVSM